jgi:hypothetical protein
MKNMVKKNVLIKLICVACLILCSSFLFAGCGRNQLTVKQITDAVLEYVPMTNNMQYFVGKPQFAFGNLDYDTQLNDYSAENIKWQRKLERQNVNTEDFCFVEKLEFTVTGGYKSTWIYMYIFKFENNKAAKNMQKNYKFEEDVTSRRYGNLVVAVDNLIQADLFRFINTL